MLRTNDEEKHAKRNVDALEVPQFCLDVALFFASAEIRAYCDRSGGAECVHLPHCDRREIGLRALRIAGSVAAHCVVHARFGGPARALQTACLVAHSSAVWFRVKYAFISETSPARFRPSARVFATCVHILSS